MKKYIIFIAVLLAFTTIIVSCSGPDGELPLKQKTSETTSQEGDMVSDSESASNDDMDIVDTTGAYFSLEKNKYIFDAGEDFALPVPTIKNISEEEISLGYNVRIYDESSSLLYSNSRVVNLDVGYYSLYYSFKDTCKYENTLTVVLIAVDPEDIPLVSFNDAEDLEMLIQPPKYNRGTQNGTWNILTEGKHNSIDGVLEITAGDGYEDITHCRDGAGILFYEPMSVTEVKSFKVTVYQDTNEFDSRVVVGFYTKDGIYSEEFWYHQNKKSWHTYEFSIESILEKKWHEENGDEYEGEISEIYGIYVRNVFCLDKMYIDGVSYKK